MHRTKGVKPLACVFLARLGAVQELWSLYVVIVYIVSCNLYADKMCFDPADMSNIDTGRVVRNDCDASRLLVGTSISCTCED